MRNITHIITLLLALFLCLPASAQQATPESLTKQWSKEAKADLMELSPFMLKLASKFVSSEGKAFLKSSKKISIIDLADCSPESKTRFKQQLEQLQLKGYIREVKQDDGSGNKVIVFIKAEGEYILDILCASVEKKNTYSHISMANMTSQA